ncbi:MAG: SpoIIE family protein phosphatase [Bacteroidales bacterium]
MRNTLFFIPLAFILLQAGHTFAQPNAHGVPLITNYPFQITGGSEQNWCVVQDKRGVMYFGNQDKGVLEYDGHNWRTIPLPNKPTVRSLATGPEGIVYVGAEGDLGRLQPDSSGSMVYHSFLGRVQEHPEDYFIVWKTYVHENKVYYCTVSGIHIYDPATDTFRTIEPPKYGLYSFFVEGELYTPDFGEGLLKYRDSVFVSVPGGEHFVEKTVVSLLPHDPGHLLVATYYNGLSLLDTRTGALVPDFMDSRLDRLFREGLITTVEKIDGKYLVGTQYKGLFILDRQFRPLQIISTDEGMINNTVAWIYANPDRSGDSPLWIANFDGISKIGTNQPFQRFNENAGFEGLITDIAVFEDRLFISTLGGLYYKHSSETGTNFIKIPGIQEEIWKMEVIRPNERTELLLVSADRFTFVLDRNLNLTTIQDRLLSPPENREDVYEIAGDFVLRDPDHPGVIFTGVSELVGLEYQGGRWQEFFRFRDLQTNIIEWLSKDVYGYVWVTGPQNLIRVDVTLPDQALQYVYNATNGLPDNQFNRTFRDPETGEVLIGTKQGFYRYDYYRDVFYSDTVFNSLLPPGKNHIRRFYQDRDGDCWISFENERDGWSEIGVRKVAGKFRLFHDTVFRQLPNASVDVFCEDPQQGIWFSKSSELFHFDKRLRSQDSLTFRTLIRSVRLDNDSLIFGGADRMVNPHGGYLVTDRQEASFRPHLHYKYNNISFTWAAPYFEQEEAMEYSHRLLGFDRGLSQWSEWSPKTETDFTNLRYGSYNMQVRARNIFGETGETATFAFTILRPWYATYLSMFAYILLAGFLVYLVIKIYTRRLVQENIRLEGIITERTTEIRKQKEELTDSIEYASRIQRALLPPEKLLHENGIEHFILFRPRDIVSGDFYWMGMKDGKLLIVVADCTGHGVPGAFMSMLGMTFLDEIVIKSEITDTGKILDLLREHVITSLRQSGKDTDSTKDGMDLAMVALDTRTRSFQFSGAYNPMYLVRPLTDDERKVLKRDGELDLPRGRCTVNRMCCFRSGPIRCPSGSRKRSSRSRPSPSPTRTIGSICSRTDSWTSSVAPRARNSCPGISKNSSSTCNTSPCRNRERAWKRHCRNGWVRSARSMTCWSWDSR